MAVPETKLYGTRMDYGGRDGGRECWALRRAHTLGCMWEGVGEGRGGGSLTLDALSPSVQNSNKIGAEGVKALVSAIAQGHTPNLQELWLVSGWRGCDGDDDEGVGEEGGSCGGKDGEGGDVPG
eukprot:3450864-Rhodomonas_salina.3